MSESKLFRLALLPSAVFLSVIFGGSYGSGQETLRFVTSAGVSEGYVAIATVAVIWGLLLGTSFEIARRFKTFEYSGFMGVLLNRAGVLYEIAILLSMILVLAICASGAGTVLNEHFGWPIWVGSVGLLSIAVVLNYMGRSVVERSMVASIVALFIVLIFLFFQAQASPGTDHAHTEGFMQAVLKGGQYAIVNGGFIPLLLYCGRGVTDMSESYTAGFIAASVAVVPGVMLHSAFSKLLPGILSEALPAYTAIETFLPAIILSVYVIILFVMITQTAVGMVQGLTDRTDEFISAKRGGSLSSSARAGLSAIVILGAMVLAQVGFVALIAQGYDILVGVFIVTFVVPLFSIGLYRIANK